MLFVRFACIHIGIPTSKEIRVRMKGCCCLLLSAVGLCLAKSDATEGCSAPVFNLVAHRAACGTWFEQQHEEVSAGSVEECAAACQARPWCLDFFPQRQDTPNEGLCALSAGICTQLASNSWDFYRLQGREFKQRESGLTLITC